MPSALETIFAQVPLSGKAEPGRATILLDAERRVAVEQAMLGIADRALWSLREKLRYDVWLDEKVVLTNLQEQIPNFLTQETLPVDYRMRVWIRREDATRATVALHHTRKPAEMVVRQLIGSYIADKLEQSSRRSRESMSAHLVALARQFERELQAKLRSELGLSSELILEEPVELQTRLRLAFGPVDVRPRDAPRQAGLSLIGDLTIEPAPDAEATEPPPLTDQAWADLIRRCVETTYGDKISMRDHLYDGEKVRAALLEDIETRLRRVGRRVRPDSFQIRARSSEKIPAREAKVNADYAWKSERWNRFVLFKAEARMTLLSPAAWPAGQERDLNDWFRKVISAAIRNAMHGRDFDSLELEDDPSFRAEVAAEVTPLAAALGYKLELLLFVSENEPRKALEQFSVRVPPSLENDWPGYETKRPGVCAKFQIEVRMRLTTLKGHAERFRGNHGLPELYEEAAEVAREAARRHMRSVDAETYINQWDVWRRNDETGSFTEKPLYQELRREIERDLQRRFAGAQLQISLYRDLSPQSDFKSRATQITLAPVKVRPSVRDTQYAGQEAEYDLQFSIYEIDSEHIVEVMATGRDRLEKARIEEDLTRAARDALKRLSSRDLQDLHYEDVTRPQDSYFAREMLAQVQRAISPKYAILLRLDSVERSRTKEEVTERDRREIGLNFTIANLATVNAAIAEIEANAKMRRLAIQKRIGALDEALLQAQIAADPDLDLIETRKRLLHEATQEQLAVEDQVRTAIARVRGDIATVGAETPAGLPPSDGAALPAPRAPDEID